MGVTVGVGVGVGVGEPKGTDGYPQLILLNIVQIELVKKLLISSSVNIKSYNVPPGVGLYFDNFDDKAIYL